MPNYWAHRICAERMLRRLDGNIAAAIIRRNAASYRLGALGADLLYFRPTQFLRGQKGAVYHAKMLHSQPVETLARLSREYLEKLSGRRLESVFSYVCGFLNHHAVDESVHARIETLTGNPLRHRRIELDLDAYLTHELAGTPDRGLHPWSDITGYVDFAGVALWYNHLFWSLYTKKFSLGSYIRDYRAARRASGLLDRPRRLTKSRHMERPLLTQAKMAAMASVAAAGTMMAEGLVRDMAAELDAPSRQTLSHAEA